MLAVIESVKHLSPQEDQSLESEILSFWWLMAIRCYPPSDYT